MTTENPEVELRYVVHVEKRPFVREVTIDDSSSTTTNGMSCHRIRDFRNFRASFINTGITHF